VAFDVGVGAMGRLCRWVRGLRGQLSAFSGVRARHGVGLHPGCDLLVDVFFSVQGEARERLSWELLVWSGIFLAGTRLP